MYKNHFEFVLNEALAKDTIKEFTLYAPRNIHRPITAKIDGAIRSGLMEFSKMNAGQDSTAATQTDQELDSENLFGKMSVKEVLNIIKMIPSKDNSFLPNLYEDFKALMLSSGICKVKKDDSTLTAGYYDQMSVEDGDRLLGEYIKNFFTISLSS